MVQVGRKKYKKIFKILLSYLACSQIWLNLPLDHTTLAITQNFQKSTALIISHIPCLLTFSYLPNTYLHVPSCWLAKPHNSPSCPITHKLGAPVQLVMSSNWLNCTP